MTQYPDLRPSVWIGKRGITPAQIAEIKAQLARKKLIKVKILRSALDNSTQKEIAAHLASEAGASVAGMTGMVIVLRRGKDV